ncbi:hypothetical protein Tco_1113062 [Tanacetum coccineum]|uniref:Uncharacterized protein n=1 Tax=Tanacetum coccineum TaxID=301880 RepID=A0ABQ5IRB7_9ASTR
MTSQLHDFFTTSRLLHNFKTSSQLHFTTLLISQLSNTTGDVCRVGGFIQLISSLKAQLFLGEDATRAIPNIVSTVHVKSGVVGLRCFSNLEMEIWLVEFGIGCHLEMKLGVEYHVNDVEMEMEELRHLVVMWSVLI